MLQYLVCPKTNAPLYIEEEEISDDHILEGMLINSQDSSIRYPIQGGIPRFLVPENFNPKKRATAEAFSFKWSQIPGYAYEKKTKHNREQWFFERFGFSNGDTDVQRLLSPCNFVLEAGLGTGVDTDMLARNFSGRVFGIDISDSIEIAYERFRERDNIFLAQADLGQLPFKSEFFDIIICDQVLHHTPEPRKNFSHLIQHICKNGYILFYVYNRKGPVREFCDDYLRDIFTQSSLRDCLEFCRKITCLGRNLCRMKEMLQIEEDIPELGLPKGQYDIQRLIYDHMFKCFWNEDYDFETNMMVNFDWYRPFYAYRFHPDDIRTWCSGEGLNILHFNVCTSGISVIAQKTGKVKIGTESIDK